MKNNIRHIFREQFKNHKCPTALVLLAFIMYHLVLLPFLLNAANNAGQYDNESAQRILLNLQRITAGFLCSSFRAWIPVFAATILTLDAYSYLFKKQQIDFYESQPVSRNVRFHGLFLYNLLVFSGGLVSTWILALAIAGGFGALTPLTVAGSVLGLVRDFMLYLAVSGFALLAVMLTGNMVVCALAFFCLQVLQPMFSLIISQLQVTFLKTAYDQFSALPGKFLSPYYLHVKTDPDLLNLKGEKMYQMSVLWTSLREKWMFLIFGFVIAALLYGVSYLFYQKRKNESAGSSVVFAWVRSVVRVILTFIISSEVGFVIYYIFNQELSTASLIFSMGLFMVLSGAFTAILLQIIYEQDFRALFHRFPELLICVAIPMIVMADSACLSGFYDRRVPDEATIQAIAFCDQDNIPNWMGENGYVDDREYLEQNYKFTSEAQIRDIVKLAKDGQNYTVDHADRFGYLQNEDENSVRFVVFYKLKNGKTVRRRFTLPEHMDETETMNIVRSREYVTTLYPFERISAGDGKLQLRYENDKNEKEMIELSGADFKDFQNAFIQDVMDHIDVFQGEGVNTTNDDQFVLEYGKHDKGVRNEVYIAIRPGYLRTRKFLADHGMKIR